VENKDQSGLGYKPSKSDKRQVMLGVATYLARALDRRLQED